jgi:hypothetical protein
VGGSQQRIAGPQIGIAQAFLQQVAAPKRRLDVPHNPEVQPQLFPKVVVVMRVRPDVAQYAIHVGQNFDGIRGIPQQPREIMKVDLQVRICFIAQKAVDLGMREIDTISLRQAGVALEKMQRKSRWHSSRYPSDPGHTVEFGR